VRRFRQLISLGAMLVLAAFVEAVFGIWWFLAFLVFVVLLVGVPAVREVRRRHAAARRT
jgi:hypothetical protein